MLRILFAGLKFDYGRPELGLSLEFRNFYDSLKSMEGVQVDFYAVDEEMLSVGRDKMNAELIRIVESSAPDLLFCCLYTDELKRDTITYITTRTRTKTFNWFCDDSWRFWNFSRHWAPLFTTVSTTDSYALAEYSRYGIRNVIMSQWAVNPNVYGPRSVVNGVYSYDISFVGQKYGNRGHYIRTLERSGLGVVAFGRGFPAGRIQFEEMLRTFSRSRINLNFSGTPALGARYALKALAKLVIKKKLGRYKFSAHGIKDEIRSMVGARRPQIKNRIFEVPACAGFLMTTAADGLDKYYTPNREIVIFENSEDLVDKCRYYLAHEGERQAIAEAGYRRTLREHTYAHRFREIFQHMGLIDKMKDTKQ